MSTPLEVWESQLLELIRSTDGAELYRDDWHTAERLVKKGLITLGPARGPKNAWRRAELKGDEQ